MASPGQPPVPPPTQPAGSPAGSPHHDQQPTGASILSLSSLPLGNSWNQLVDKAMRQMAEGNAGLGSQGDPAALLKKKQSLKARQVKTDARRAKLEARQDALEASLEKLDKESAELAAVLGVLKDMEAWQGEQGAQAALLALASAAAGVFALDSEALSVQEGMMKRVDEVPELYILGWVWELWQLRLVLQHLVDSRTELDPPARRVISRLLTEAGSENVSDPDEGLRTLGWHVTQLLLRAAQMCLAQDVSRMHQSSSPLPEGSVSVQDVRQHAEVFARQLLELYTAEGYDPDTQALVSRAISDLTTDFCYQSRQGTPAANGCVLPDALAEELLTCIKKDRDQAVAAATRELQKQVEWAMARQAAARTALAALSTSAQAATEELEAWRAEKQDRPRSAPPGNDVETTQVDDDMPAGDDGAPPDGSSIISGECRQPSHAHAMTGPTLRDAPPAAGPGDAAAASLGGVSAATKSARAAPHTAGPSSKRRRSNSPSQFDAAGDSPSTTAPSVRTGDLVQQVQDLRQQVAQLTNAVSAFLSRCTDQPVAPADAASAGLN